MIVTVMFRLSLTILNNYLLSLKQMNKFILRSKKSKLLNKPSAKCPSKDQSQNLVKDLNLE